MLGCRRGSLVGLVVSISLLLVACAGPAPSGSATSSASGSQAVTVTDYHGRTLNLPGPAKRTVFLVENAMNTMLAVGGGDKIVGTGEIWQPTFKTAFLNAARPGFSELPVVGATNGVYDLEALAALKPDFVVLWAETKDDKSIAAITDTLKIPVYAVFLRSFADLDKLAIDMAAVNGTPERGAQVNELVSKEMADIAAVTKTVAAENQPKVFWMWGDIFGTAGTKSSANELIVAAGGRNVIADWNDATATSEHPVLSMETLAKLDPDVIYMWFNPNLDPADVIAGKKVDNVDFGAWANLKAVKNKRVYELDDPFMFDFMTGRLPVATAKVAKDLHPQEFAAWDDTRTDKYFVAMYGVHYPGFAKA